MLLINVLIFTTVFAIATLLIVAFGRPKTAEKTQEALASALKTRAGSRGEEVIDFRLERRFSTIPWFNRLLARTNLISRLSRVMNQAAIAWTPGKLLLISALTGVAAGYVIQMAVHYARIAVPLGLAASMLPLVYVLMKRAARFRRMQERLPETLDLMVSALRAGNSMNGALGIVATEAPDPLRREFRLCFEEQNFGVDLRTALEHFLARVPLQDLRMMTTAMLIHKESGGNLAEVLEKTAFIIRERSRLHQQIRVRTAQGRLTGLVLILLPMGLAIVLELLSPGYVGVLFDRPLGHKLIAGALILNVTGLLLIRKIVNIRI